MCRNNRLLHSNFADRESTFQYLPAPTQNSLKHALYNVQLRDRHTTSVVHNNYRQYTHNLQISAVRHLPNTGWQMNDGLKEATARNFTLACGP